MLYDPQGRQIPEAPAVKPVEGRAFIAEPADYRDRDVSRGLTPAAVDRIMCSANSGDTADQCRLAFEIEEKNWDISHALQTRRMAALGAPWQIEPGDESPAAKTAAETFEAELRAAGDPDQEIDSFGDLRNDLLSAILPGFAVSEILWGAGGVIRGFSYLDQRHFTFRDGRRPKLITKDNPNGIDLPARKVILHGIRRRGPDVTRSGLIRPLAWLHVFANLNIKDLLSFIERYGMPFVIAKVDEESWQTERNKLRRLIRNFGPSGGGLFTKATEVELLQAANNTGDVYFKLLEFLAAAVTKVVLGQLGTSGEGGWSNNGAQSQVRQDILEGDCGALDDTLNTQLANPWSAIRNTVPPRIVTVTDPPEDQAKAAEKVRARYDTIGTAVRAGMVTPTAEDEVAIREELGLPVMPPAAKAAWDEDGGARKPITLQSQLASQVETDNAQAFAPGGRRSLAMSAEAPDAAETIADAAVEQFLAGDGGRRWAGKLAAKLAKFATADGGDDSLLRQLSKDPAAFLDDFDTGSPAEAVEQTIYAAAAAGMADSARRLRPGQTPARRVVR